ncbi:hypothetical protein FOA43_003800 [Brettanomyces nanus]|uniref:Actin-related protein 8 n=1 Tax=Eeniella nana TaxID=13502 RepID=A0A875S435_EENNA|nr:uncharacterized protein FOA43_003800 [Brettanomyces nanus]QPG76411.1 hypothetical protein FOA43_003800 [Brettanomyces nanus]
MPPKKKLTLKRPNSEDSEITGVSADSVVSSGGPSNGSKKPRTSSSKSRSSATSGTNGTNGTSVISGTNGTGGTSAAVLQRRREGRIRAMERLQTKLNELGIRRVDDENRLNFSSITSIQFINQKNYFTDYLKRDEQFRMIRQMKERVFESRQAKKKKQNNDKMKNQDIIAKLKHTPSVGSMTSSAVNSSGTEDDDDDADDNGGEGVIIFHPGSENIRIGRSTDVNPIIVKNIVAYKLPEGKKSDYSSTVDPSRELDSEGDIIIDDPKYLKNKKAITTSFKERMRFYKRRIVPNSHEACYSYNKQVRPEIVPDHNDIHKVEYLQTEEIKENYVIGEDVFRLQNLNRWLVRSPFLARGFNDNDLSYDTPTEILGDIELILMDTLRKKFGIGSKKDLASYNCIFVIPNMYHKSYVETMVDFLLNTMGFSQIALIEEGLAATFGSGISTGCVIDVGAATTKVCCVEEGMIIPNSQIVLNYGSNDITRFFIKNLLAQQFPYKEINLNDWNDWKLANELKQNFVTFNDVNVAVQGFSFVSRKPGREVEKFQFKVFDEVMVSPMALFYPDAFIEDDKDAGSGVILGKYGPNKVIRRRGLFENRAGIFEGFENDDPMSLLQQMEGEGKLISEMDLKEIVNLLLVLGNGEDGSYGGLMPSQRKEYSDDWHDTTGTNSERKNMTALDEAVLESITMAGYDNTERLTTLYGNISLIGGGSKIEGFDQMLLDRLNITRSPILASNKLATIVDLVRGWKEDWTTTEKKKREKLEQAGKNADKLKEEKFELTKSQLQRISNVVNNSQLLPIEILVNANVDPSTLSWKGGSVFARLKILDELWLNQMDWDRLGSRGLNYVSMFSY